MLNENLKLQFFTQRFYGKLVRSARKVISVQLNMTTVSLVAWRNVTPSVLLVCHMHTLDCFYCFCALLACLRGFVVSSSLNTFNPYFASYFF